ncbi:unnamed protein product, partial [marine sediment metagenome]
MIRSKTLISQLLTGLKDNIQRTGDPLGIKAEYWTEWAKGLNLLGKGETIILTGRMYQMLPYITSTTSLLASTKGFLSRRILGDIARRGSSIAGEKAIMWKAKKEEALKSRSAKALCGITKALSAVGYKPAYLYEDEPYSGALLYDLGLDKFLPEYITKVYSLLKERDVKEVIGVDPHTVFMLKEVYPRYINNYELGVRHYLDILAENIDELKRVQERRLEGEFVVHDSCVMARDLGITEPPRKVLESLGIKVLEPENTKLNTVCCGGPIEYAFPHMADKVC